MKPQSGLSKDRKEKRARPNLTGKGKGRQKGRLFSTRVRRTRYRFLPTEWVRNIWQGEKKKGAQLLYFKRKGKKGKNKDMWGNLKLT